MKDSISATLVRACLLAISVALFAAGCGGSSSGEAPANPVLPPATGTIGLLITDKPSDQFSEINVTVSEAVLIGSGGQQTLLSDPTTINLLDLTNFSQPVAFGEVDAGTFTKLRLLIDSIELVPNDGSASIAARLPSDKLDLLEPGGFTVLPGRTLLAEVDIDANKSIKYHQAGNSMQYIFRPVAKVHFMDGGLPDKLARLEGVVAEIPDNPAGSFLLCAVDSPETCVTVYTDDETSLFDADGLPVAFDALAVNDPVVVIGRYRHEEDNDDNDSENGHAHVGVVLDAVVVEIGGNAEQVSGTVVTAPSDGSFLVLRDQNGEIVVELQDGTRVFDEQGETDASAILVGVDVEVEGVIPEKADEADPDLIRAALVFLEHDDDEQLAGTIADPIDAVAMSFILMADSGDVCVSVDGDADILLVDEAASEVTMGSFDDLAVGQSVEVFGAMGMACFEANEVIVAVEAAGS